MTNKRPRLDPRMAAVRTCTIGCVMRCASTWAEVLADGLENKLSSAPILYILSQRPTCEESYCRSAAPAASQADDALAGICRKTNLIFFFMHMRVKTLCLYMY